jgi:osmoprotectant transport system substrate-binding protein
VRVSGRAGILLRLLRWPPIWGNLIALLVLLVSACTPESGSVRRPTVRIGSTNFSEQIILAELYANALEGHGYRGERKLRMGNREVVAPALERGEIDFYVESLATAERFFAGSGSVASSNPATTHRSLLTQLEHRGIAVLDYAPAVDQNGLVVTRPIAAEHRLQKTSDLAPIADQLVLGGPPECPVRPFCQPGLERVYGIRFKDFRPLDPSGPMTVAAASRGDRRGRGLHDRRPDRRARPRPAPG